jgi:hypothetical protein
MIQLRQAETEVGSVAVAGSPEAIASAAPP